MTVKLLVAATITLAMLPVIAVAQTPLGGTIPPPPPVVAPPSGPAVSGSAPVTVAPAMPRSVVIPGSPVPGTLYDNGNGTSTVVVPGGGSQVIPTPR